MFAYGQTGSGKTHTMVGIQALMAQDLFALLNNDPIYANIQVKLLYSAEIDRSLITDDNFSHHFRWRYRSSRSMGDGVRIC